MASTLAFIQPRLLNSDIIGAQPNVRGGAAKPHFKETAAQSWVAGDLIYQDASLHTLSKCTLNGTPLLSSTIAGIANKAATGVTGTAVQFHMITPWNKYLMNVYHGTPASAVIAQTHLGGNAVFGITNVSGSSNRWVVDLEHTTLEDATTALARVKICDIYTGIAIDSTGNQVQAAIGDTYGLAMVHFLPFSIQTNGAGIVRCLDFY